MQIQSISERVLSSLAARDTLKLSLRKSWHLRGLFKQIQINFTTYPKTDLGSRILS